MKAVTTEGWHDANQRYLLTALNIIRKILERHASRARGATNPEETNVTEALPEQKTLKVLASSMAVPPALETLIRTFDLSPFERDVLLLCAGVELDARFATLCAAAQADSRQTYPTFSLALAMLAGAHWSALTREAPLRHWNLIEVKAGETLTTSPLSIDERVLHYLVGISHLDERLRSFITPLDSPTELPESQRKVARRIVDLWSHAERVSSSPVIQLLGDENAGKNSIAALACATIGFRLHILRGVDIPSSATEREDLCRLWSREAALGSVLLVDCEGAEGTDTVRVIISFIENIDGLIVLTSREPVPLRRRLAASIDARRPTAREQRELWLKELGPYANELSGEIDKVVAQFDMNTHGIHAACANMMGGHSQRTEGAMATALWEACRAQWRPQLQGLAQRIEPAAHWEDIVLPEQQLQTLHEIAVHNRQRSKVYDEWGFTAKTSRGLGISLLFVGASGTGKTMAAEVLADDLRLDLYRIDLSQVVSKYIGETEKNLRRVFDAAEGGGAILLFDEADALFGKRSEVKDSHDRYANIQVSYLLQRMEAYRGLSILTTNMKEALDQAFIRRIRFIVQFPFPDAARRAEIWHRIFPANTPMEGLDFDKLARLNVAGGNICNIAMNAAFLAAEAGEPVRMKHLLRASRTEYAKLDKSLTEAEIGGWV